MKRMGFEFTIMPIKDAAKKALRQSKVRRDRNIKRKEAIKSAVKEIRTLVQAGKKEEAKKLLSTAYKSIDKALKKKVIKPNTAARKKSRIALLVK